MFAHVGWVQIIIALQAHKTHHLLTFKLTLHTLQFTTQSTPHTLYLMANYRNFLHKLDLLPPHAHHLLTHIRQLDQQVEMQRMQLSPLRTEFLGDLANLPSRRTPKQKHQAELKFKTITAIENQIQLKTLEKINTAERLYNLIQAPTHKLQRQIHQMQSAGAPNTKSKPQKSKISKTMKGEWKWDPKEPTYCYCQRPSFGEMVICDNPFCHIQWFHLSCIDEKELCERWFCLNCREEGKCWSEGRKNGRKK